VRGERVTDLLRPAYRALADADAAIVTGP
jgi:hypothetical protein